MENASDALIMAANILIFLIALTITISSFSTVRAGIDNVIGQTEVVEMAQIQDEYVNYIKSNEKTTRVVGAETVISSIYRSLTEDNVVYVQFKDNDSSSYKIESDDIKIDVFLDQNGKRILKFTEGTKNDAILKNNKYNELMNNFYNKIKNMKFEENLGEYKQGASSVNDKTRRIITYTQME